MPEPVEPVPAEVDPAPAGEAHALALEAQALGRGRVGGEGGDREATAGPDDAVPGKAGGGRGVAEDAADEAGPAGQPGGGGDIAVGGDPAGRDPPHGPQDGGHARRTQTSKWTPWASGSSAP
jgi:hypothetical protein